jgi:integrase/recombinase XerD
MIKVTKIEHKAKLYILLKCDYCINTILKLKQCCDAKYTNTHKGWIIEYTAPCWAKFVSLDLPYTLENKDSSINVQQNELPEKTIDQPGTATSPTNSDIAGIAPGAATEAPSIHPSNGDSKGIDIHQSKGGRSIEYNGGKFYITIHYNDDDIQFLKSLKGFWQSKIRKWIIKATLENLTLLQKKYAIWSEDQYKTVHELILNVECPYLVTLYRSPEYLDKVMVQITGNKANVSIIKMNSDRCYQKDEQRWTIPNDKVIVQRLKEDYIRDGATVINRLPEDGYDYHKKKESYGQYKARYLAKTELSIKPIVERYIDTLIAIKRSPKTMTTYLGPFIKFVKYIGLESMETITSREMDKYMAMISSNKASDGYLHNAYNAIMFYYRDVLRNNESIVKEARRPKKASSLPSIMSLGEVDRILRAMENVKHATILYTFYSSGIRLAEILNLRVEDMWWERGQIFIKNGKGDKDRVVPFSGVLKDILKLYFDQFKPIYWLFEGQDKKLPYSERSVQKVVKSAAKKAAIHKRITPHSFRHSYATHLLDGGTDIRYIQELLGHSDIKTTLIYTHVTNHSISKIMSPLDKLMLDKGKNEEEK